MRDLLQGQQTQAGLAVEKRVAAQKRMQELFAQAASTGALPDQGRGQLRGGENERLENWSARVQIPPDTLASSEGAPPIRLPQIVAEAKTHTLLEYHMLEDGVAIWVVNPQCQVFAYKQTIPKDKLYALIDSARQALGVAGFINRRNVKVVGTGQSKKATAYAPILKTLDSLLIQPLARYLPKDTSQQLIILPHDNLFVLPFACLMDSSGKYLVQRYAFSTAPSVGLLKFAKGRQREQQYLEKPTLLLMGNPQMPDSMWSSLTGAEKEVKLIAETVNLKKGKGFQAPGALPLRAMALTNKQATEAEYRQIAGIQNYVHLATHGYVVSNALRCGLVLAKTGNAMETDGILTTAEIFGLPLNAELVVLSACQTGLGEISSDGVAGLSRAFLYAGAASLMVSLWKVDDAATQFLMVKFYEELARDGNKARALRAAQLSTMKKYPAPSDWAAFVLVGQPR